MFRSRKKSRGLRRSVATGLLSVLPLALGACDESVVPGAVPLARPAAVEAAEASQLSEVSEAAEDALALELLAELRRLETALPSASTRQARPEGSGPVAAVPRELSREFTATVVVREEPDGAVLSREIFRVSPECVSVTHADGAEWWLARNPVHRRELSGAQADPAERLVLVHSAADLRLLGCDDQWERIAGLGSSAPPGSGMTATGCSEQAFGLEFAQWVASDEAAPLREVLWCEGAGFALRSRALVDGRSLCREIAELEWRVDPEALRSPVERHPDWHHSEISDWGDSCSNHAPARDHAEHAHDAVHAGHAHGPAAAAQGGAH